MDLLKLFLEFPCICTDTRQIKDGSLFFALKGETFNGNTFATQALALGSAFVIVDETPQEQDSRIIQVDNVLEALQNLACAYRHTFDIPFLAITGSNGKTTTKELIREVLSKKYNIHATKGNFNNHLGVPLTLLSMPKDSEFALIEMGANHEKEIEALCQIALPDYGMITNIGEAHLEGFGDLNGVIRGKSELYRHLEKSNGTVFLNTDMDHLQDAIGNVPYIPYGLTSDNFTLKSQASGTTVNFEARIEGQVYEVKTQLAGQYNMANFASAMAVGLYFGVSSKDICAAIADYTPDNQRSQITKTAKNTLILDAYNANPTSMKEALKNLHTVAKEKGFFILGDMFEMGDRSAELHQEIVDLASQLGLDGIVVGKAFAESRTNIMAYKTRADLIDYLKHNSPKDRTVLIKGSRGMKLEEIVDLL